MSLHIDQAEYPAQPERNLLEVCLSLGFDLPYFCWHPALGSVGACRQCAVKQFKDENDTKGRLVMACMTPASDGTRISIADQDARTFRAEIIEWLMTNHPHDCPVCDEGGECHLQDMTVMSGHVYRRCRAAKRTFRNQYLGPFVNHEMNRCITCYRCVRFYRDYAGGDDLQALASRNRVYFGRAEDGVLASEFAGNLVEVCPTGVFTDATLKHHYTRKWDFQNGPSICPHCAQGCNTLLGERYGTVRRVVNRYHHHINSYFLCDRGRYGYGFLDSDRRLRSPLRHQAPSQPLEPAPVSGPDSLLPELAEYLAPPVPVIGIGSPRASLEANFALRHLVGPEHFYAGVADGEWRAIRLVVELMNNLPVASATVLDAEDSDGVLVLGEDVLATAPRLALALRRSTRHGTLARGTALKLPVWDAHALAVAGQGEKSPLILATPCPTRLDDAATATWHASPQDLARFGHAVAHALDSSAPATDPLDEAVRSLAEDTAVALGRAERPLVVAGVAGGEAVIQAAANVALALHRQGRQVRIAWGLPECDSLGLALLEPRPLTDALAAAEAALAPTAVVLENDLYRRAPRQAVDAFLAKARVVAIDYLRHPTLEAADIALPAASFAEGSGTLVNGEGRAQRYFAACPTAGEMADSWHWLGRLAEQAGKPPAWASLDEATRACAQAVPALAGIVTAAPPAPWRMAGGRIPRQPPRYSGRTAMHADRHIDEPAQPTDPDSPLAFSMEGEDRQPPAALITFYRAPGWNSVQALNKFQQEVGGELRGGDPGLRLPLAAGNPQAEMPYFQEVPPPFQARAGEWLLLPRPRIFGSEELSMASPPVAERAEAPCLDLHPQDAAALQLAAGDSAQIHMGDDIFALPVRLEPGLAPGTAALPAGMPGLPWLGLPAWGSIRRERP